MEKFNAKCQDFSDFINYAHMLEEDYGCEIDFGNEIDDTHILVCPECSDPIYFCDMLGQDIACPACGFTGLQDDVLDDEDVLDEDKDDVLDEDDDEYENDYDD